MHLATEIQRNGHTQERGGEECDGCSYRSVLQSGTVPCGSTTQPLLLRDLLLLLRPRNRKQVYGKPGYGESLPDNRIPKRRVSNCKRCCFHNPLTLRSTQFSFDRLGNRPGFLATRPSLGCASATIVSATATRAAPSRSCACATAGRPTGAEARIPNGMHGPANPLRRKPQQWHGKP